MTFVCTCSQLNKHKQGHNSRPMKGILTKLAKCIVVKNIMQKTQNIWQQETMVKTHKPNIFANWGGGGITLK